MSKIFTRFLKKPTTIGAICASTEYLAEEITSDIGLESCKNVVELGPGTGVFTSVILRKISPGTSFLAVEIDEAMYNILKKQFPNLNIHNKDAAHLKDILQSENIDYADIVISGLPWAAFHAELQDNILDAIIKNLHPKGVFVTFAYYHSTILPAAQRFKKRINDLFDKVEESPVVWRNIPPAFVYRCRCKKKQ